MTTETAERAAGVYTMPLDRDAHATPAAATAASPPPVASGKWTLAVDATDDVGQVSRMTSAVTVNRTVVDATSRPRVVVRRPNGTKVAFQWQQTESARVVVTVERLDGSRVRTLLERRVAPGLAGVTWNGLGARGVQLPRGTYVVHIAATNRLGKLDVLRRLTLR